MENKKEKSPSVKKGAKEKKYGLIGIRMSLEEEEQIRANAALYGYYSLSLYCKNVLLGKRISNTKRLQIEDTIIRSQIAEISAKIGKIGINYNQVVRLINSNTKKLEEKGQTENVRATVFYLQKLEKETEKLIGQVSKMNEIVKSIESRIDTMEKNYNENEDGVSVE